MSDTLVIPKARIIKTKEYGDFQTPYSLTNSICKLIKERNFEPTILIEPSCGKGNFIVSALKTFASIRIIVAIEIQKTYKEEFFNNLAENYVSLDDKKIIFITKSFFDLNFTDLLNEQGIEVQKNKILIIGNPPWVTNSYLGSINSINVPLKTNSKVKLKGLDALTGKSNFDVAETFIIKLLNVFSDKNFVLAIICKTATLYNVLQNSQLNFTNLDLSSYLFDAKKEFGISATSNIFIARKNIECKNNEKVCSVYPLNNNFSKLYSFGYENGNFVSNIDNYKKYSGLEGKFCYEWRQGIKHDAGSILVLEKLGDNLYKNKLGDYVELEDELIYPFLKSSDIKKPMIQESRFWILITQKKIGEKTSGQIKKLPKTWQYLQTNKYYFKKRKSRIYTNQQEFSIFGIGDYSFKSYKIVISGFYKKICFSLVLPGQDKPIMVDDTCYSLSFETLQEAVFIWIMLNLQVTSKFFNSITFLDNKRPFKKDILQRLNLKNLIKIASEEECKVLWNKLNLNNNTIQFKDILTIKSKFK